MRKSRRNGSGVAAMARARDDLALPLTPEVEGRLLAKIRLVQEWVSGFASTLGKRRVPRVRTRLGNSDIHYAPIENILLVPALHLLAVPEPHLRIAVAHEMGHFSRRWPSLFAWTFGRRMDEELHADRAALTLTGVGVDAWCACMRSIAEVEGHEWNELDIAFQARKKLLQRWVVAQRPAQL